jgi:hypothetical protein
MRVVRGECAPAPPSPGGGGPVADAVAPVLGRVALSAKASTSRGYRAVVSAVDAAGNASAKRTVKFRVVER